VIYYHKPRLKERINWKGKRTGGNEFRVSVQTRPRSNYMYEVWQLKHQTDVLCSHWHHRWVASRIMWLHDSTVCYTVFRITLDSLAQFNFSLAQCSFCRNVKINSFQKNGSKNKVFWKIQWLLMGLGSHNTTQKQKKYKVSNRKVQSESSKKLQMPKLCIYPFSYTSKESTIMNLFL
jgi:hypothetical protein